MSNDSRFVLAQLTRTGIWSGWCNLLRHKHLVLEADSVVTFLYQQCISKHLKRQRALQPKGARGEANLIDYYAATLINFRELAELYEQLLDFFAQNAVQLVVVYRGKHMEAPLFGLAAAQLKKNTQRASEPLMALADYEKGLQQSQAETTAKAPTTTTTDERKQTTSQRTRELRAALDRMRPTRPNLALNLFKQIVASRQSRHKSGQAGGKQIECHQAFYCPYPVCARLARDLKCPVMTNDGDFVVMDVRAGFILFEEFFSSQLMASSNFVLRQQSAASFAGSEASTGSMARNQLTIGARSPGPHNHARIVAHSPGMVQLSAARDLFQTAQSVAGHPGLDATKGTRRSPSTRSVKLRFHFHRHFLLQHPGLNSALALQLFPLTSGEFLLKHAQSLVRLRIFEREYKEQDLIMSSAQQTSFKKYHMAAARLERVMRYLCAKDPEVVPNLVRGEAKRLAGAAIEQDYCGLYNYYAVAYDFRSRLTTILGGDRQCRQLPVAHIESVLVDRECTADFWLGLSCSALAKLASLDYNKSVQFEDLATRHSARAMLDRPKRLLMNVLAGGSKPSSHGPPSAVASSKQSERSARVRLTQASITVIDRQCGRLLERKIDATTIDDKQLEAQLSRLRSGLTALEIAQANRDIHDTTQSSDSTASSTALPLPPAFKSSAVSLINLIFKSRDMTRLAALEQRSSLGHRCESIRWLTGSAQVHSRVKVQLAILLSLHRFSVDQALDGDQYFRQHYSNLGQHFEMGLIYSQLCSGLSSSELDRIIHTTEGNNHMAIELKQVVDLINRLDLVNVANFKGIAARVQSGAGGQTTGWPVGVTKRLRHLIELLDDSIEAYCEVNAFLNYPQAQLQLQNYNPILLFNMIAFSLLGGATPPKPRPLSKPSVPTVATTTSKKAKK